MGILYNRFTPEPQPQSLIPYSNQSDIVTYLVPSSFQGSSSTTWGDDYPKPFVKDNAAAWSLNSDNSVRLSKPNSSLTGSGSIDLTSGSQREYTVYMVVKYNAEDTTDSLPNLRIVRATNFYIYRAYQDKVNVRFGSANVSTLTPSSSAFGNYHVYAFRQKRNSSQGVFHHVVDDGNLVQILPSSNPGALAPSLFDFNSTREVSIDIKFLSIVMGSSESDSTVLNNVQNLMTKLQVP